MSETEQVPQVAAAFTLLMDALVFYADPENYHAIAIFPDRPAGAFGDDYDDEHGHPDYDRPMHGSKARAALRAWGEAVFDGSVHD